MPAWLRQFFGIFQRLFQPGRPSMPPPQTSWTPPTPPGFGVQMQHHDPWGVPVVEQYEESAGDGVLGADDVKYMAAQRILTLVKQNFVEKSAGGSGADGLPWAPLSPQTLAARARKGTGTLHFAQILRDTGMMFGSLGVWIDADTITVGTNDDKARYHHEGTSRMPARPLWPKPLPRVWLEEIREALKQGIRLQMRAGK